MTRILVADDEEDMAVIIRERLESCGYQVAWASDGGVAWDMFEKNDYDLIILDIRMPVYDGYKVYEMIRRSSKSKVPILFMSAFVKEKEFRERTHGEAFLAKPFQAKVLISTIQKLLQGSGPSNESPLTPDFT